MEKTNNTKNPWPPFIQTLKRRMHTDWDNMIGLQGERGSGKSTLALRIALALDPEFNPDNVFYDPEDWGDVVRGRPRQIFILDEGTNIAFNRTWQSKQQQKLVQLLNTIRQRNHTFIWCAPNLERMDTVIRGDILKYRLSTLNRGLAVLHQRHYNWEKEQAYWVNKGYLTYRSLEWHPIWEHYEARKRESYLRSVEKPVVKAVGFAVNPEKRNKNRDPITNRFIRKSAELEAEA